MLNNIFAIFHQKGIIIINCSAELCTKLVILTIGIGQPVLLYYPDILAFLQYSNQFYVSISASDTAATALPLPITAFRDTKFLPVTFFE